MIIETVKTPKIMCIVTVLEVFIIRQALSVLRSMYLVGFIEDGIGCILQLNTSNLSVLDI